MPDELRTVLIFGTFDIIHPGHQWFLHMARKKGDRLVAAVARDAFIHEWKGAFPVKDETTRQQELLDSGLVDKTILSDTQIHTYGVIHQVKPDIICLGHDQQALHDDLTSWLEKHTEYAPEVIRLPPWNRQRYSSTLRNQNLRLNK